MVANQLRKEAHKISRPSYRDLSRFLTSLGTRSIVFGYVLLFTSLYFEHAYTIPSTILYNIVLTYIPILVIGIGVLLIILGLTGWDRFGIKGWKDRQQEEDERKEILMEEKRQQLAGTHDTNVKKAEISYEGDN